MSDLTKQFPNLPRKRLAHLSSWDMATKLGATYSGDMNCLQHGGVFYRLNDFDIEMGYVCGVRVEGEWTGVKNATGIEQVTINLPNDLGDLFSALKCAGFLDSSMSQEEQEAMLNNPQYIVEAVIGYRGAEVDYSVIVQCEPDEPTVGDGWTALRCTENQACNLIAMFLR